VSWLSTLGAWGASAWLACGLFFALGCLLAVHAVVLLHVVRTATPRVWEARRASGAILLIELVYGLLAPLLYLLALARTSWLPWHHPAWLRGLAWILLALVWTTRLAGTPSSAAHADVQRRALHVLLSASLLGLGSFLVADVTAAARLAPVLFARPVDPATSFLRLVLWLVFAAGSLSLYLIPATLLWAHLRTNLVHSGARNERWLLGGRPAVRNAIAALVLIAAGAWAAGTRGASPQEVRRWLRENEAEIVDAARSQAVEPRLLAALLYVVRRDLESPLSRAIERVATARWLVEPHEAFLPPVPFDAAIGPAQVRPSTAVRAARLYARASRAGAAPALQPPLATPATRERAVGVLLDERGALSMAAFVLGLLEVQWHAKTPEGRHDALPELLATLYGKGSVRVAPRGTPVPSAFGRAVRSAYERPWIKRRFDA
jgi:hypothetical protein